VGKQYDHMVNDHPGYNPENLAYVYIGAVDSTGRAKLIEETQRLPEVDAITTCYNLPFWGASGNNVYLPGDDRELFNIADLYDVGNDYLNVLEIPIVEGQYFTENTTSSQEILVSRNFIEYMKPFADWKDGAVGKTVQITGHDTKSESMPLFTIRGVFEDFRLGSIAGEDPRAKIMFYTKGAAQHMVIRYHSLSSEALRKTQDLMGQLIPDKELNVISFKSEMLEGYTSSRKFRDSVMIGGIVTLLIVFIGLI
ncbi:MAG: ABC transporter permease, partial [Parabacteroides distasonis]